MKMKDQKTTKKTHGGARQRAGRKPVDDPKIQLSIYPLKSIVDKLGTEQAKVIAIDALIKAAKKLNKS
jgi:hypothetical protein